jgi:hypothetical protein
MRRRATCSGGKISVTTEGEPVRVSVCHCLACQRRTGSTYGAQALFPTGHVDETAQQREGARPMIALRQLRWQAARRVGRASQVRPRCVGRRLAMALLSLLGVSACGGAPAPAPPLELPVPSAEARSASKEPVAEPLTPEALLARLPRSAGAYVAVRWAELDAPLAPLLVHALRDGDIGRLFGEARSIAALLKALRIDPTRPIVFAASAPTRGDGAELVDMLATDTRWEELALRIEAMAPIASTYRVVIPLAPTEGSGVDDAARDEAVVALRAMFQRVRIETTLCPGDPRCSRFGKERPSFLVARAPWLGAVYADGASVELELARTRHWKADNPGTWELLARAREATRGGPEPGRCAMVEPAGAAWVCVDADRFASYGTAEGNLSLADALSGFGFDPGEHAMIAEQGRKEVARIGELARPSKVLLDAGSASLRVQGTAFTLEARWRVTEHARADVERALTSPQCGSDEQPNPFFAALRAAFPKGGLDYVDPRVMRERLMEAGWGGQGVAFARTWPNLVSLTRGHSRLVGDLGVKEACAAQENGELSLRLRGRAPWSDAP